MLASICALRSVFGVGVQARQPPGTGRLPQVANAGFGQQLSAGRQEPRDEGLAHRLPRAAIGFGSRGFFVVFEPARGLQAVPAQSRGPFIEFERRGRGGAGQERDAQVPLDRLEMRQKFGLAEGVHMEFGPPLVEDLGRRAVVEPAVDLAAAAHAAAFDIGHLGVAHGHGHAAVAVLLHHFLAGEGQARFQRQ